LRAASNPKLSSPLRRATTTPPSTAEFSAIWRAGASSVRLRICMPVFSSPSRFASSRATAATEGSRARPPPGRRPNGSMSSTGRRDGEGQNPALKSSNRPSIRRAIFGHAHAQGPWIRASTVSSRTERRTRLPARRICAMRERSAAEDDAVQAAVSLNTRSAFPDQVISHRLYSGRALDEHLESPLLCDVINAAP
jgi:hypothetical protein